MEGSGVDVVLNLCWVGLVWLCRRCRVGVVVLVGMDSCCCVGFVLDLQEKCKTAKESVASNRRQRQEIEIPVLQLLMEDIR